MTNKLVVVVNGESVLEYDRNIRLPGHQRAYLDRMDKDMEGGITLGDSYIEKPNALQKAQFVTMRMLNGLIDSQDAMVAASCAYLANRVPELKQVRAVEKDEEITFDLVFDKEYQPEATVEFMPKLNS
jgi:hypothetical protein